MARQSNHPATRRGAQQASDWGSNTAAPAFAITACSVSGGHQSHAVAGSRLTRWRLPQPDTVKALARAITTLPRRKRGVVNKVVAASLIKRAVDPCRIGLARLRLALLPKRQRRTELRSINSLPPEATRSKVLRPGCLPTTTPSGCVRKADSWLSSLRSTGVSARRTGFPPLLPCGLWQMHPAIHSTCRASGANQRLVVPATDLLVDHQRVSLTTRRVLPAQRHSRPCRARHQA